MESNGHSYDGTGKTSRVGVDRTFRGEKTRTGTTGRLKVR